MAGCPDCGTISTIHTFACAVGRYVAEPLDAATQRADAAEAQLAALREGLGRIRRSDGQGRCSNDSEAFAAYDAMEGRALAAEAQVRELRAELDEERRLANELKECGWRAVQEVHARVEQTCNDLRAELARVRRACAEAVAVLKVVELRGPTIYRDATACHQYTCPCCGAGAYNNTDWHRRDCRLAAALKEHGPLPDVGAAPEGERGDG